jgi:putative heme-binding domain-containing protein
LKNGTVSAGVTTMESPEEVRLILPAGQELVVPRRDIARVERDAASLMPTGVEEGLSDQELADLLAWLVR